MTAQEIYDSFSFLEGLVSEETYNRIGKEVIKLRNNTRSETLEEAATICDLLSKLYYDSAVGFDMGYTMGAIRGAKEIRKIKNEQSV